MRCMRFDLRIHCAPASDAYLKKQRTQAICCVILQTYYLTNNQNMVNLFTNFVSLSTAFHLEYCKQLERENHQKYLTLRRVIHKLCNTFLNTIQKHYKHSHFLYSHNYLAVCVNNTDKLGYILLTVHHVMILGE